MINCCFGPLATLYVMVGSMWWSHLLTSGQAESKEKETDQDPIKKVGWGTGGGISVVVIAFIHYLCCIRHYGTGDTRNCPERAGRLCSFSPWPAKAAQNCTALGQP